MTMAKMMIIGARMAVRMIIMNDICTLVTSVVMRVTSDGVENRSMVAKEKV